MPETVVENFSTALLCMYFAVAREGGKFDLPIVWLGPKEPRPWGELFHLDRTSEVWMCRNAEATLDELGVPWTPKRRNSYGGLRPDLWVADARHAIIVENKARGRDQHQEESYYRFLNEQAIAARSNRAFIYSVPDGWATPNPDPSTNEWWHFVAGQADGVLRGLIKWDREFAEHLCSVLRVPRWFWDKLPHRIGEEYL